ncbi:MAG: alpha/beta hydrolase [Candidatus Heimdallarchaeota archaeon]|nr:alpha/beta hydrolase [Candidatus Heimdallarchaeota archaeon]
MKEANFIESNLDCLFINESTKVSIKMSDGEEIFCQYTLGDQTKPDFIMFFIQGFASGYFTWSDCWDAFYQEFNMVIVDPRDKLTNKLTKKSKCTMHRIALDFVEAIQFLKLEEEKIVLFGSSIGASYVAHLVGQKMIKPKGSFLTGTSRRPRSPRILVKILFLLPGFILNFIGKIVAKIYMMNKVDEGFQREIFEERIRNVDFRRWKLCKQLHDWDASTDFMNMVEPVFIIRTPKDKYHEEEELEIIQKLIPNCKIINVPNYDFTHTKPEVFEFARILKEKILKEM